MECESAKKGNTKASMKHENMKHALMQGLAAVWPVCVGYVPIGIAFGVLARKAGLTPLEIGLMSLFVFAGSSQFIAVSMLSSGAASVSIILTTFIVNIRHLLMSSSLAVFLGNSDRKKLSLFAYGVTDESFAVNLARFREGGWDLNRSLAVNHTANMAWVASTVVGGYGGQFIPERAFGIDYALIAMFICLLIFQVRSRKHIVTAILAGVLAVIFSLIIPGNIYVVLASVLAATLMVAFRRL